MNDESIGEWRLIFMRIPINLRIITEKEFHKLKVGDIVYVKASGHTFQSRVLRI